MNSNIKGPNRVVEQDGSIILIIYIKSEAHRPFKLPANGWPIGEIKAEKFGIYFGELRADVKNFRVLEMSKGFFKFSSEFLHGKSERAPLHIKDYPGEMFRGLDVHIFAVAQPWEGWGQKGISRESAVLRALSASVWGITAMAVVSRFPGMGIIIEASSRVSIQKWTFKIPPSLL